MCFLSPHACNFLAGEIEPMLDTNPKKNQRKKVQTFKDYLVGTSLKAHITHSRREGNAGCMNEILRPVWSGALGCSSHPRMES